MRHIAIVVPAFNESERWQPDYWVGLDYQIRQRLPTSVKLSWVFVDDGSHDNTVIKLLATAKHLGATVLEQGNNRGKAEAVRCGMIYAMNKFGADGVGFIDADGAFDLVDVARVTECFLDVAERGFDAMWSSRVALAGRNISRSASRHYLARIVSTFLAFSSSAFPYDSQSGLKFFVADESFTALLTQPFETRWLFEVELLARHVVLWKKELKIWEEPLNSWNDIAGSKITSYELLRIGRELITAQYLLRRSEKAMRRRN
jgi:glycosyltransferase involved in cell wall biosynthesis